MIIETPRYQQAKNRLPERVRRVLGSKVHLLATNPSHPGLRVHKLRNADAWEAYIGLAHRLLFRYQDADLLLLDVGRHSLIDRLRRKEEV